MHLLFKNRCKITHYFSHTQYLNVGKIARGLAHIGFF